MKARRDCSKLHSGRLLRQATRSDLGALISLRGKRALISGAASGIGRAISLRYAEAGAELVLVDIDEAALTALSSELRESGCLVREAAADMASKAAIDALWEGLDGLPEILVNNAGLYPMRDFLRVDQEFLRHVVDVNLSSVFWMCQRFLAGRRRMGGVILNVGSIEAIVPFQKHLVAYSVSKAGVIALTRALAKEYGPMGFRVNAVLPGGIDTPGTRSVARQLLKLQVGLVSSGLQYRQRLPLGRFGTADEVARMALVLVSDLAAYVHGAVVPVDGGFLSA